MKEFEGFRVRMYPTEQQEQILLQFCHAYRFTYNWALFKNKEVYEKDKVCLLGNELEKEFMNKFNNPNDADYSWLHNGVLKTHTLLNAVKTFTKNFKRFLRDKRVNKPKPKSRHHSKLCFNTRKETFHIYEEYVTFEGFTSQKKSERNPIYLGKHNIPCDRKYNYCDPHIEMDKDGRWWFSCSIKLDNPISLCKNPVRNGPIGIDLGIKNFVTTSDNEKFNYPIKKLKKLEKRRKRQERRLSRDYRKRTEEAKRTKTKSADLPKSNNMLKRERAFRKTYAKQANIRKNTRYHIAKHIIEKNPRAVVMEGLNVTGMKKNHNIAKHMHHLAFYDMRVILEQKCKNNDIRFILADRWFPSSKLCSRCGNRKQRLPLSERTYKCEVCGLIIDRDYNAALNLRDLATIRI